MVQDSQQQNSFDYVTRTGASTLRAATDSVGRTINSFDYEGAANKLAGVAQNIADKLRDLSCRSQSSPYIVVPSSARAQGMGMIVCGCALVGAAIVSGWMSFGLGVISATLGIAGGVITALVGAGGVVLAKQGAGLRRLADDVDAVREALSTQVVVPLDDLAPKVELSAEKLHSRLERAIKRGFIPQGRLDLVQGEDTLFLTDGAYHDFENYKRRVEENEAAALAEQQVIANLPDRAQESIAACKAFGRHMMALAGKIADKETRERMALLTEGVARVSEHVCNHPEDAVRLRRFVTYYLPTTEKLVDAYAELDVEGITGDSADDMRAEVDETLELVARAVDNLLEELLLDRQLDIASDASTMRKMLTQDGLTD